MTLTAQQQANRLRGVGGSEVLAACGKDPRCSMLELYHRKIGDQPPEDLSANERVHFGNLLEPVLRKEVGRRLGVQVVQRHQTLFHHDAPLVGHIDGWIRSQRCGVEIKTVDRFESSDYGEQGTDQVPTRHWLQCAAYMALTDADRWHLCALIGGNDLRIYVIRRNYEIEEFILAAVRAFWRHVDSRQPPQPQSLQDIRLRWPKDLGTTITATTEIASALDRLRDVRAQLAQLTAEAEASEFAVKSFMGDHAELTSDDGRTLATWRTSKPSQRLDSNLLAKDHPALFAQYQRMQPGTRRFLLK